MADTSLADYFTIAPSSTTWGLGQNALAQALPILMQGRGTTNQQFGTALGMSLVSALLGYQARRSAADQSLQAAEIGSQMLGLATPQERLNLIKGVDSSNIQQSLLGLNARIGEQELTNQLIQRQKVGELTAGANFELSPLGQQLQAQKLKQAVVLKALEGGNIPSEYASLFAQPETETIPIIPGLTAKESRDIYKKQKEIEMAQGATPATQERKNAFGIVQDLEQTFKNLKLNAAEFNRDKLIPGTPAELAWSKLNGSLAALARVSGQTSQLSDTDLRQQRDSIQGPTIMGVPLSGTESIAKRLQSKLEASKQLANKSDVEAQPETDKLAILAELRAEIAAAKARRMK